MWRFAVLLLLVPLVAAHEDEVHQVPAWSSGTLVEGDTYERSFSEVRTHGYVNGFSNVAGSVRVIEGGPASASVTVTASGFSPPVVDIGPGGRVTWTVAAAGTHTVTSSEMMTPEEDHGEESPLGLLVPMLAIGAAAVLLRRRL